MCNKRRSSNLSDPRWPPGRRRSEGTSSSSVYIALIALTCLTRPTVAICPARCTCNNVKLEVSCTDGNLEVVPIQLNPQVKRLTLSNNKISSIYQTLTFYTNVQYLDVSSNKIKTLGNKNFEFQSDLLFLNLSDNQISRLGKDSLRGLKNVQILDLSQNQIEDINEKEFRDLIHLQELILHKNKIISITLANPNLKRLDLKENQLLSVPTFSHNLTKLAELDLGYNLIESIQEGSLPHSIEYFNLRSNVLRSLDNNSMSSLYYLEYLDLSDNNLTRVPFEINKLLNLKFLNLSSNFFYKLKTDSFINLYQLNEIYLDNLPLYSIDSKMFLHNINLNVVSLSNNELVHLPNRLFHHNVHLKHLFLSGNRFATLDGEDLRLDNIRSLKLSHNPFTCNCTLLWLYNLKEKQTSYVINGSVSEEVTWPVLIDLDHVVCHAPEHLHHLPFKNIRKSDLNCELTLFILLLISLLILLVVFIVLIVVYIVKFKKSDHKTQCDQYIEAAKHFEDTNRTYYNYTKPNVIDLLQNSEKANMYVSRPVMKDLKTFNKSREYINSLHRSDSSAYSLDLSKNDLHIYQEPFTTPVYNNKRPPNIVYV